MSGPAEQYEDDFEKDLDWLISEEEQSHEQVSRSFMHLDCFISEEQQDPENEDVEAQIDKELEEEEEVEVEKVGGDERWPSPLEPSNNVSDGDGAFESLFSGPPMSTASLPPSDSLSLAPLQPEGEEPEEEKRYILEKIQQANQQLNAQAAPDHSRRRRLQFKDLLVDLVVPPEYEQPSAPQSSSEEEHQVSGRMSELHISLQEEGGAVEVASREGRVLVEKDGKFDLVSLREVESQGLLPPLPCSHSDAPRPPRHNEPCSAPSPRPSMGVSMATEPLHTPKPPPLTRNRPNSAGHNHCSVGGRASKRRVQSASNASSHATFTLSSEQKHLQLKQQQKKERIRREELYRRRRPPLSFSQEEERRREDEAQKRQENELAFRAWMQRKREQLHEDRRVHRAQEMEKTSSKREPCDPQEAFKHWLKRKQEQQVKERQLEELKRLEEESGFYLHNQEESERAFKLWLKRKRAEKRAETLVARERSRRLVMEARRARRVQDLLCTVSEAKSFRFTDHYGYHY